jgi:ABC-type sugar transport system substrate-binding protein
MTSSRLLRRPVWAACFVVLLFASLVAAGCGGSDSDSTSGGSTNADSTSGNSGGATAQDAVAAANKVAKLAETDLLYGPTSGLFTVDELRAPTQADLKVPKYKDDGSPKKIVWINPSPLSATGTYMAEVGEKFLKKLGIETATTDGDYTPTGYRRAFDAAFAMNPDAIITIGIDPNTVGASLARAKSEGVWVVNATGTEELEPGDDAYVPQGSNLQHAAYAAKIIQDTEGEGKINWLNAREFPTNETAITVEFLKNTCPTCDVTEGTETAAQVTAPVPMNQLITSILRAEPDLDWLQLAHACALLPAATSAIRETGADVGFGAGSCGAAAIGAMNSGNLPYASGGVEALGSLLAITQALLLIEGKEPLSDDEIGVPAYLVTPETTPDDSTNGDITVLSKWLLERFDFVKPFEDAWGVELKSVIEEG